MSQFTPNTIKATNRMMPSFVFINWFAKKVTWYGVYRSIVFAVALQYAQMCFVIQNIWIKSRPTTDFRNITNLILWDVSIINHPQYDCELNHFASYSRFYNSYKTKTTNIFNKMGTITKENKRVYTILISYGWVFLQVVQYKQWVKIPIDTTQQNIL